MTFAKIFVTLSLLVSSLSLAFGDLSFIDGGASGASLQQYGAAQAQVSLLLSTKHTEKVLEQSISFTNNDEAASIVTEHEVTTTQISSTSYNVTVALSFEGWVGDVSYTVSVITMETDTGLHRSYAAEGTYSVYGLVLYETDSSGKKTIVSGDDAPTVAYESYESALSDPRALKVAAHGPDGMKLSDMSVQVRDLVGNADSKLLSESGVTFGEDVIYVAPNKYRVGSGKALVTLEHAAMELHGESFETQFVVEMGSMPMPPPVVTSSGEVTATTSTAEGTRGSEASFALDMFNMKNVSSITATMNNVTFTGEVSNTDEESVVFSGSSDVGPGVYKPALSATLADGRRMSVVVLEDVGVVFGSKAGASGSSGSVSGRTAGLVAGLVGMVIASLACVAAFVAWRSRRAAAAAESSFASDGGSSWADGNLPAAFSIQRDVYGRGSVSADGSEIDVRTPDAEFWRVV